jgi:hypothetical protein
MRGPSMSGPRHAPPPPSVGVSADMHAHAACGGVVAQPLPSAAATAASTEGAPLGTADALVDAVYRLLFLPGFTLAPNVKRRKDGTFFIIWSGRGVQPQHLRRVLTGRLFPPTRAGVQGDGHCGAVGAALHGADGCAPRRSAEAAPGSDLGRALPQHRCAPPCISLRRMVAPACAIG